MAKPHKQFSLFTLLSLMTIIGIGCAVYASLPSQVAFYVTEFLIVSIVVLTLLVLNEWIVNSLSIQRTVDLVAFLAASYCVNELVFYTLGEWVDGHTTAAKIRNNGRLLIGMTMLVGVNLVGAVVYHSVFSFSGRSWCYFPRLIDLWGNHRTATTFAVGACLIVAMIYFAESTAQMVYSAESSYRNVVLTKRTFTLCNLLWGLLWVADCCVRRSGGDTIVLATILFAINWLVISPLGMGMP